MEYDGFKKPRRILVECDENDKSYVTIIFSPLSYTFLLLLFALLLEHGKHSKYAYLTSLVWLKIWIPNSNDCQKRRKGNLSTRDRSSIFLQCQFVPLM